MGRRRKRAIIRRSDGMGGSGSSETSSITGLWSHLGFVWMGGKKLEGRKLRGKN